MPPSAHREIEVKLRVRDLPRLLQRLRRLGATSFGRVFERNDLYDTPFGGLRRSGQLLRLRVEKPAASRLVQAGRGGARLTYKGPARGRRRRRFKDKIENERPVSNPNRWRVILRALGLRPTFRYEKFRSTFRYGGVTLDLDETPVGTFLELEGSPRAIDRVAPALGYRHRDYLRSTYWDLYAAACRREGRKPRNMVFGA
jgi:adenylate cyclase, class 2